MVSKEAAPSSSHRCANRTNRAPSMRRSPAPGAPQAPSRMPNWAKTRSRSTARTSVVEENHSVSSSAPRTKIPSVDNSKSTAPSPRSSALTSASTSFSSRLRCASDGEPRRTTTTGCVPNLSKLIVSCPARRCSVGARLPMHRISERCIDQSSDRERAPRIAGAAIGRRAAGPSGLGAPESGACQDIGWRLVSKITHCSPIVRAPG